MADGLTRSGERLGTNRDQDPPLDPFRLDRGLDSISRLSRPETPLPDAAGMPPAAQSSRPELEKLVGPSLDDYQAESLQPRIADRQMLIPHRFEQTLRAAAGTLRTLAESRAARAGAGPTLRKAAALLADEASLRELLGAYRSALYQG